MRVAVVLCGATGVKTKTLSTKKKGPGCKHPIEVPRRAVEKLFFLDILSHRMSVIAMSQQLPIS